ncbi:unnamed protein product [Vitrella brassicaformis CCMP3155]|uniref:C3H1-type domain-containing protein n=1 Tax=Vitrella brassicaformis (strain CCMP3155) TaxID=1169540 RepID=A0A0G4EJE9_VITBC|nr:unnamed protein product [Vitrella brassicaformis CCMP3155]|eukprot:CEL96644.1 unnamed protein product [Vitrella brassicaformis CCMP3155]
MVLNLRVRDRQELTSTAAADPMTQDVSGRSPSSRDDSSPSNAPMSLTSPDALPLYTLPAVITDVQRPPMTAPHALVGMMPSTEGGDSPASCHSKSTTSTLIHEAPLLASISVDSPHSPVRAKVLGVGTAQRGGWSPVVVCAPTLSSGGDGVSVWSHGQFHRPQSAQQQHQGLTAQMASAAVGLSAGDGSVPSVVLPSSPSQGDWMEELPPSPPSPSASPLSPHTAGDSPQSPSVASQNIYPARIPVRRGFIHFSTSDTSRADLRWDACVQGEGEGEGEVPASSEDTLQACLHRYVHEDEQKGVRVGREGSGKRSESCPPMSVLRLGGTVLNIGSMHHVDGDRQCPNKRCYWFSTKGGCWKGRNCDHCHLCLPRPKKRIYRPHTHMGRPRMHTGYSSFYRRFPPFRPSSLPTQDGRAIAVIRPPHEQQALTDRHASWPGPLRAVPPPPPPYPPSAISAPLPLVVPQFADLLQQQKQQQQEGVRHTQHGEWHHDYHGGGWLER